MSATDGGASAVQHIVLTLVLDECQGGEIHRLADAVSSPGASDYGRFIDGAELRQLVMLPDEEIGTIRAWLVEHGMQPIDSPETSPQLIFVKATLDQVERTFGAALAGRLLRTDEDSERSVSRLRLALPRRLAGYVKKVGGLPGERGQSGRFIAGYAPHDDEVPSEAPAISRAGGDAPPADLGGMTPADIRRIYSFPDAWDGRGETIGLMMLGGVADPRDLTTFWKGHGIEPPDVQVVQVGPSAEAARHPLHDLEVAMTIQWAGAMAPGARIVVYSIDPTVMADPWAAFLFAVLGDEVHRPTIACTSWITPERQYYQLHGSGVITGLLDQAAVRGITVVSAAGDWGAFDGIPRAVRDGRRVVDAPWPHAVFPACEERVLSVGGTMITSLAPLTELAWSGPPPPGLQKAVQFELLAGSGGFSEEVPAPAWQRPLLRSYYSRGASSPAVVPYGRGFPDVAMMAAGPTVQRASGEALTSQGYQAVAGGQWIDYAGGTSVGAPIWAAIVARMNEARRAAGLPRVGFVNPLLYSLHDADPPVFREITAGSTDVAMQVVNHHGKAATFRLGGYEATYGWDPVTGLGVPHVANLIGHAVRKKRT